MMNLYNIKHMEPLNCIACKKKNYQINTTLTGASELTTQTGAQTSSGIGLRLQHDKVLELFSLLLFYKQLLT